MTSDQPMVLAIDDQEANLRLIRAHLRTEPYRVVTSTEPLRALELVDRDPPDLVLLDVMMPELDGFGVLEALRRAVPDTPVVMITALDDRDARLRGLAAGARDFLGKPVDRSELLIRVRNLIALKQTRDELKATVQRLQAANRDLEAFAGALAHDLQQPVTAIAGYAEAIQVRSGPLMVPGDAGHLDRIITAARWAQRMASGLLEFARLGQRTIQREPVDLNEVVAEARACLAEPASGRPVAWTVADLPVVDGDRTLLGQVFTNLLSNAVKYSGTRPQPAVVIDCRADAGKGLAVRVSDNGVGFDMAKAGRLFTPFERLHSAAEFQGTGMGLANVRRIMESHGGSVHAESTPGQGSTFTLVFRPVET
jgi:two-component system, sensor histidine kinase and response regulator